MPTANDSFSHVSSSWPNRDCPLQSAALSVSSLHFGQWAFIAVPIETQLRLAFLVGLFAFAAGCSSEIHRYVRFPNLFHPGTAAQQRAEALEHDPFPQNDIGPPVVGGRPLGYQAGVEEVDRMTMNAVPPPGVPPTIVPGAPVSPLVGPQYAPTPAFPAPTAAPPFTAPAPVITTPFPPSTTLPYSPPTSMRTAPGVRQRSPY